mgnify:CR=1 FL=1
MLSVDRLCPVISPLLDIWNIGLHHLCVPVDRSQKRNVERLELHEIFMTFHQELSVESHLLSDFIVHMDVSDSDQAGREIVSIQKLECVSYLIERMRL